MRHHLIVALPGAQADRRRALDWPPARPRPFSPFPRALSCWPAVKVNEVRDIEPEDLLGRPPVQLDGRSWHFLETINSRVVLVTGAGGSIGSKL